jgi:hypothetical protein
MKQLKLIRSALTSMFAHLGYPGSEKWDRKKMLGQINKLPNLVDEDTDAGDHAELLDSLIEAVESGTPIHISNTAQEDDETMTEETPETTKPTKKVAKKKTVKKKAASASKPTKKVAKKATKKKTAAAPAKKVAKKKGPGVLSTIADLLQAASAKKPITKAEIAAKLEKAFPDRDPESMAKTVGVQVPSRISTERGIDVQTVKKDGTTAYFAK